MAIGTHARVQHHRQRPVQGVGVVADHHSRPPRQRTAHVHPQGGAEHGPRHGGEQQPGDADALDQAGVQHQPRPGGQRDAGVHGARAAGLVQQRRAEQRHQAGQLQHGERGGELLRAPRQLLDAR
ncbi:MAG TPA: hypothetical protein VNU01_10410, partial [Egibacteraceae bacterium]|nr:hypothetical protein [Egibacteraceae bacterium]